MGSAFDLPPPCDDSEVCDVVREQRPTIFAAQGQQWFIVFGFPTDLDRSDDVMTVLAESSGDCR